MERKFDTKSDVWSFGIFLWELFTLGMAPYTGINFDAKFLNKLQSGYRMKKPRLASQPMFVFVFVFFFFRNNLLQNE